MQSNTLAEKTTLQGLHEKKKEEEVRVFAASRKPTRSAQRTKRQNNTERARERERQHTNKTSARCEDGGRVSAGRPPFHPPLVGIAAPRRHGSNKTETSLKK
jgi:hypothetical protein